MATRLKEWMIPYTWWIGIEITDNHVINVLLRAMNNLIMVNEDRELYVDLQLEDWILPEDDFPVWVTTGKILEEDWWQQSGQIINWKTTSWDYNRLIHANDGRFYVDLWDWIWRELWFAADINTKTFYISNDQDLTNAQSAYNWHNDGKDAVLWYDDSIYILVGTETTAWMTTLEFRDDKVVIENWISASNSTQKKITLIVNDATNEVESITLWTAVITPSVLSTWVNYQTPYTPEYDGSPATKKYVDDGLALKQDKLIAGNNIQIAPDWKTISAIDTSYTAWANIQINNWVISATDTTYTAWTRITIDANNVISADISGVLTYKWNVATINDLPSSWQVVWDTYFVEWANSMYSWDGTQWNLVWGTGIDLTNYFNKTIDDSDDITQWSIHLFVTQSEKNYWNSKQDALTAGNNIQITTSWWVTTISATDTTYTAGDNITISNGVISWTPYTAWQNVQISNHVISATDTTYTAWDWISITNNVITNTDKFDPENTGSLGQFLKKTNTGYAWANVPSSWWWTTYVAWDWIDITGNVISNDAPFEPTNSATTWYVLKASGRNSYYWAPESWWGGWGNFNPENTGSTGQVLTKTWTWYAWESSWPAWDSNVKLFTLSSLSDTTTAQAVLDWTLAWKLPIIRRWDGIKDVFYYLDSNFNSSVKSLSFEAYLGAWVTEWVWRYTYHVYHHIIINYSDTRVTQILHNEEERDKSWKGTQSEYNQLTPIQWVVYNITSLS